MSEKSYSTKLARPSPLFIGIDLGTSGCRAIAINEKTNIIAQSAVRYQGNQTPGQWWHACQAVIKNITEQVNHYHIEAIAVDGTSGTVLLCDDRGKPLTPALMYNDSRATDQAQLLSRYAPGDSITTNSSSGLAKVLWLLEHHPPGESFHIVHQADWVAGMLCQKFTFSDSNNALKTGYDVVNRHWPVWLQDLFKEKNIPRDSLPAVHTPGTRIAAINPIVASALGLPLDTSIIAGTTDSTAAFIASTHVSTNSKIQPGDAVTSLGSTMVLKVVCNSPINKPAHGIYSQPLGRYWLVGGASNTGGTVLNYYFTDEKLKVLSEQINPSVAANLDYYPLLKPGERFPVNDPTLEPRLTPKVEDDALFLQGILEGIADIEHNGYKLLQEFGAPYPDTVITAGGGAVNLTWAKIREQKLGAQVKPARYTEAAYGTALLAAENFLKVTSTN